MRVFKKTASESIQLEVDFRPWLEYEWFPGTYQEANDVRRPSEPNGHEYRCTVAGYTGAKEPDEFLEEKPTVGQIFIDGGVRWACQKASEDGQDEITSIDCTAETGLTVGSDNFVGDIGTTVASGGTPGESYLVSFEIHTADGWDYEEKVTVQIYGP